MSEVDDLRKEVERLRRQIKAMGDDIRRRQFAWKRERQRIKDLQREGRRIRSMYDRQEDWKRRYMLLKYGKNNEELVKRLSAIPEWQL